MVRVHVVTNLNVRFLLKQSPNESYEIGGIKFSFGLSVPRDCEAVIIYSTSKYSFHAPVSRNRIAFFASEPSVIHRYPTGYLEQFGLLSVTEAYGVETEQRVENYCSPWYAGLPLHQSPEFVDIRGWDFFDSLRPPEKQPRLAIIASIKAATVLHRKREAFIRLLMERIGDRVELFGTNYRSINDKIEAILPFQYNLALENSSDPHTWTEKLTDPLLCWSLPFHVGCSPDTIPFPKDSFVSLDIDRPEEAVEKIVAIMDGDGWRHRQEAIRAARRLILDEYNIMQLFVKIADELLRRPREQGSTSILSERFWAESSTHYPPRQLRVRRLLGNANPAVDRFAYSIKHSSWIAGVSKPFRRVKQVLRRTKNRVINRRAR